jgi:N,N'-diacetyllegionaminate synthase
MKIEVDSHIVQVKNCLIMAEIGLSHEGSVGLAKSSIAAAARAGADLVKFQMHISEFESSEKEPFRINFSTQDQSRSDYWQRTGFSVDQWRDLVSFSREQKIEFCLSVFSFQAFQLAQSLGVAFIKLGSGDLVNLELQDRISIKTESLILSTGMSNWEEIEQSVHKYIEKMSDTSKLYVLQCTSKYPTQLSEVGINVLDEISHRFKVKTGMSDHSQGISASLLAISKGASLIEKHVVFDKRMFGPDVSSSIDFDELEQLVKFNRDFETLLRHPIDKNIIAGDLKDVRILFGRSLGLVKDFPAGYVIKEEDFCLRKPAGGFEWQEKDQFVGRKLSKNYSKHEQIQDHHFKVL